MAFFQNECVMKRVVQESEQERSLRASRAIAERMLERRLPALYIYSISRTCPRILEIWRARPSAPVGNL